MAYYLLNLTHRSNEIKPKALAGACFNTHFKCLMRIHYLHILTANSVCKLKSLVKNSFGNIMSFFKIKLSHFILFWGVTLECIKLILLLSLGRLQVFISWRERVIKNALKNQILVNIFYFVFKVTLTFSLTTINLHKLLCCILR